MAMRWVMRQSAGQSGEQWRRRRGAAGGVSEGPFARSGCASLGALFGGVGWRENSPECGGSLGANGLQMERQGARA